MIAMDAAIARQFGQDYEAEIDMLVQPLSIVGGTFSLLFHSGMFANPEHLETMGMYERILAIFEKHNAASKKPLEIVADIKNIDAELHLNAGYYA